MTISESSIAYPLRYPVVVTNVPRSRFRFILSVSCPVYVHISYRHRAPGGVGLDRGKTHASLIPDKVRSSTSHSIQGPVQNNMRNSRLASAVEHNKSKHPKRPSFRSACRGEIC
ncbi:hypothetical protein PISMIDRAFT_378258 [Pisolithus microcarpus 441]|uniref:Uncharacterized protein n=1 Tax=Pisolithus microcarpus 441 TaxID=765257 RepID=A0A0C9ZFX3_9AGAM|nr:hypothetical protein PISMIDRAFT_378258 [Pisolithus microcarpus 441]